MKREFETFLTSWPSLIVNDRDLSSAFPGCSPQVLRDLARRATAWGWLIRVKRGLFVIGPPFKREKPSQFELAQHIYGPSYISMESALSYHQLIPEAVYATVSMSAKRKVEFDTQLGLFIYHHLSPSHFYEGVARIKAGTSVYLMATPLKALGDYVYVTKKDYTRGSDIAKDLRIEPEELEKQDPEQLGRLIERYPSKRVRRFFQTLKDEYCP